jgi:hypothetical protein
VRRRAPPLAAVPLLPPEETPCVSPLRLGPRIVGSGERGGPPWPARLASSASSSGRWRPAASAGRRRPAAARWAWRVAGWVGGPAE